MVKSKKTILVATLCAFVALCLSVGFLSSNRTQKVQAESDYTVSSERGTVTINVNRDCTIGSLELWGDDDDCEWIELNGHTLTVTEPFETKEELMFRIKNGTVIYSGDEDETFATIEGGLDLYKVTFTSTNCECLFYLEENDDDKYISIEDCKFIDCTFDYDGGAFYFDVDGDASVYFDDDRFYDCTNNGGSMIYINNLWSSSKDDDDHARFGMSGCVFDNCVSKKSGSCIYVNTDYIDVGDLNGFGKNVINNCSASGRGGAIYAWNGCGYGLIKGFVFTHNKSGNDGGAICLDANGTKVEDCYFIGNSAGTKEEGGAIYLEESYYTITNCYFCENTAYEGGAIYDECSDTTFKNCYFACDNATNGKSREINKPINMNNCHFYNLEQDKMFDDTCDHYFENSWTYNNRECTINDFRSFLGLSGNGSDAKPFEISSQKIVYLFYVNKKYTNPTIGGNRFVITMDNLIWFEKLSHCSGIIDGRGNSLYLIGTDTVIADGNNVRNYYIENRNGFYSVRIGNGFGTLMSSGSLAILFGIIAGASLITAGVFMCLYFKAKKKSE